MRTAERYLIVFLRTYLGAFNLASGLNWFVRFLPQPRPIDPTGAAYMDATVHMGLFQLAKVVETVGGACLLFDVFTPFALVFLFPVTANVLVMNAFSPLAHVVASGARNFAFHVALLASYGRYYLPLIKLKAAVRPIWRGDA